MASGDFVWFTQAKVDLGRKIHSLHAADTLKAALVTSVTTPTETTAGPHFGGTGTTNFATNECTPGGNYAAGGVTLTNVVWQADAANAKFDFDDISIAQNASNPTNARWMIVYNNTDTNKRALGYVDLGSVRDLSGGAFSFALNASGIMSIQ